MERYADRDLSLVLVASSGDTAAIATAFDGPGVTSAWDSEDSAYTAWSGLAGGSEPLPYPVTAVVDNEGTIGWFSTTTDPAGLELYLEALPGS